MSAQQLPQTMTSVRRPSIRPIFALGLVAALVAAVLIAQIAWPATQPQAPAAEGIGQSWSPGGHITGSVYDGGAYGTVKAEAWSPGGHITGSVYDGGAYRTRSFSTGAPMTHLTGSVYEPR